MAEVVKIVTTGLYGDIKVKIEQLVERLPFVTISKFDADVNFVVAADVKLPKYRLLSLGFVLKIFRDNFGLFQARAWKIEVVSVDWLWACEKANKVVGVSAYRLKPFTALIICCTGLDQ
eukprot:9475794-Pyramimonas_sp.AAC.1